MKKRFELDFLGQFYGSMINEKHDGRFSVTLHLKEVLNTEVLKQALEDLGRRYPFLCGRMIPRFFWYEYEIIEGKPLMAALSDVVNLADDRVFRVLYGPSYFVVEVNHTLFDGRTLMTIARSLLLRYFELLGIETGEEALKGSLQGDELENAYLPIARRKSKKNTDQKGKVKKEKPAYRPQVSETASAKSLNFKLSASKVKKAASAHQATVSEYLLAHIFSAINVERTVAGSLAPIVASIPVDCRSFFPSRTMRNFVCAQNVTMPEVEDFNSKIAQICLEFDKINVKSLEEDIKSMQKMYSMTRFLPRKFKDLFMKKFQTMEGNKYTTGLSNVGKVKLPESVLAHLDYMEFSIGMEAGMCYYFSCITAGDVLTLTVNLAVENNIMVEALRKNLSLFYSINS